ncbi:unnamed protein product [Didymodactylos carnosus]|uniref:Uncharacterized protein n=1 Tax=Didymodactylos carnosus TaxID=1234261 RepID=A0A814ENB8_9BILA|nr:unnamed protein product [Didymodactylos carnosus]CAF3746586.1 unnamed protein product [Didymodactylos carnosus]
MKSTVSSTFLCVKGSYACRDHYIVPVDSPFGAYLLDHCCFVPYIDLLKDEHTVHHLRQTLNDLIEKLTTSKGFNKPKPDEFQFAGNGSGMPTFDDSDLDENDDDDVDYSQVTHGGMPSIYSLMETMDLSKWNSPPPETMTVRSDHPSPYKKQA